MEMNIIIVLLGKLNPLPYMKLVNKVGGFLLVESSGEGEAPPP